jgi:hypothetical protein
VLLALFFLAAAQDPLAHARVVAGKLRFAHAAMLELRREAGAISDPALRAAAETQMLAPWLPGEAYAYAHPQEAARKLREAGLLEGELSLPPQRKGDFAAAPGSSCEDGHHGYPGGLAVHTLANLLHAKALEKIYQHLYSVSLHSDWLPTAAIWHDSLKAVTLPWREDGSCGPEPRIAGTPAHHVLGLAAAMLRHLPKELIQVIASAHAAPSSENQARICSWLDAASIIATGEKTGCPARVPIEAFINNSADADYPLTVTTWTQYLKKAPKGWARFDAMIEDGNDVLDFNRTP